MEIQQKVSPLLCLPDFPNCVWEWPQVCLAFTGQSDSRVDNEGTSTEGRGGGGGEWAGFGGLVKKVKSEGWSHREAHDPPSTESQIFDI